MSKILKLVLSTIAITIFLAGCAGSGTKESDKDISGKYDGLWDLQIHKSPANQYVQNWIMNCESQKRETILLVKDGKVVSFGGRDVGATNTYVSKAGEFRYVRPLVEKASATGTSDASMVNGDIRIIFTGKLSEESGKGRLTVGIAEFGYDGCKANITYTKKA